MLQLIYPWHAGLLSAQPSEIQFASLQGRAPVLRVNCMDVHDDALSLRIGEWPSA